MGAQQYHYLMQAYMSCTHPHGDREANTSAHSLLDAFSRAPHCEKLFVFWAQLTYISVRLP